MKQKRLLLGKGCWVVVLDRTRGIREPGHYFGRSIQHPLAFGEEIVDEADSEDEALDKAFCRMAETMDD
jgi:hypothetical protein